jgi:hypothetical protein
MFSVAELEPPSFLPGQNNGVAEDELNAIFAPLTKFNAKNQLTYVQAQSVTPSDGGMLWTIRIKPGWTFHNGEPVTAQSYVNAWNATAYGPNAWANNGSFADFAGYPALNPAKGKPSARRYSPRTSPRRCSSSASRRPPRTTKSSRCSPPKRTIERTRRAIAATCVSTLAGSWATSTVRIRTRLSAGGIVTAARRSPTHSILTPWFAGSAVGAPITVEGRGGCRRSAAVRGVSRSL